MLTEGLLEILRCPDSGEPLTLNENKLCSSQWEYPVLGSGVPCLYRRPEQSRLEWGSRIKHFIDLERAHLKQLQQLASQQASLTRKRLLLQHEARHKNLAQMEKMLANWLPQKALPNTPSSQQIYSYFQLFFRDWCWPEELQASVEYFVSALANRDPGQLLLLGSGAGGLSYQLARELPEWHIVSLEHNPFLALASQHLFQGKLLKLHDYSLYPCRLEDTARKYQIKVPPMTDKQHQLVLASFPHLPFAPASFDALIAPWFFDILDCSFSDAVATASYFLKANGRFLLSGPVNVHNPCYELQWCREEIEDCLQTCFETVSCCQQRQPYLANPLDSQQRLETVLFATADGVRKAQPPADTLGDEQILFSPELQQYQLRTETVHNILQCIDRDMSYQELAYILQSRFGFADHEAGHYARLFMAQVQSELAKG